MTINITIISDQFEYFSNSPFNGTKYNVIPTPGWILFDMCPSLDFFYFKIHIWENNKIKIILPAAHKRTIMYKKWH